VLGEDLTHIRTDETSSWDISQCTQTPPPVFGPKHLQVVLHATLHHSVPAPRSARAVSVTLVDGRVLWPLQSSVGIPHRLFAGGDSLSLLHGEPPALTGRTVGTVVRAGARDEKAGVCLDVDPGANLSVIDVVEVLRWVGCDGVDTGDRDGLCVTRNVGDEDLCTCRLKERLLRSTPSSPCDNETVSREKYILVG
jgi:hypothetical protein